MQKPKILIVDDDAGISALMGVILSREGFEVRQENRSFAALATAREFRPDLALLDVDMPGKDGGVVAAELEADPTLKKTPVIFVTSLVSRSEAGKRGSRRFIAKPVIPSELVAAVQEALHCKAA